MNIDIEELQKIISENLPKMLTEALLDKYDSPIRKAVEYAVKEKEGVVNTLVNDILSKVLLEEAFKEKVTDAVISHILVKNLK